MSHHSKPTHLRLQAPAPDTQLSEIPAISSAVAQAASKITMTENRLAYGRNTQYSLALIDLFAGSGGFSLGALAAGVIPSIAVEYMSTKINDYRKNFKSTTIVKAWLGAGKKGKDTGTLDTEEYNEYDDPIADDSQCEEFAQYLIDQLEQIWSLKIQSIDTKVKVHLHASPPCTTASDGNSLGNKANMKILPRCI